MTALDTVWRVLGHPALPAVLAVAVAVLRVLYAAVSRLVRPFPRLRAMVELLGALSPDVVRAVAQAIALATGRPAPRLDRVPEGRGP